MTNLRTYGQHFVSTCVVSDSAKADMRTETGEEEIECSTLWYEEQTHIVFLAETEEAADLGGTLRAQTLGVDSVRQAGNVVVTLLHDGQSQDSQVHGDNAAANTLPLTLTSLARTVAAVAGAEEQAHTGGVHDTLLHRETLLVVATSDLEDVALELIANTVAWDFLAHAAVHEDAQLALVVDLDQLLRAIGRVGDVELHLCGDEATTVGGGEVVVDGGGRRP